MLDEFAPYALVVDDEALLRLDAFYMLEDAGFRTHEAGNVRQAIDVLGEHSESIQLLFTDVDLGKGQNGFDLAWHCHDQYPHIAILVASGVAQPKGDDLPEKASFVQKPFSAQVIFDRLQELFPDGQKPEPLKQMAK